MVYNNEQVNNKNMSDIIKINWRELSRELSGSDNSIRKDKYKNGKYHNVVDKVVKAVNEQNNIIKEWCR